MDLSIFTPPKKKKTKKCLKTLQYLVKQLLNKFNVEISDGEVPPAFQQFMNMHNLKKHNQPECIPAWEIHDTSTIKNFLHPDIQDTKCKRQSVSPIHIQLPNDLNMIRCSGHNNSHLMSVNKLPILFIHHYLYLSK
jgi:phenylalanyl-tRNA synthetase alpha subunit